MKSLVEIQKMILDDFSRLDWPKIQSIDSHSYNNVMGDTSFLLAGLLDYEVKKKYPDFDHRKWFDDCLFNKVVKDGDTIKIWGVAIWGIVNTTKQWVDPFYFEVKIAKDFTVLTNYTLLFEDSNTIEITYHNFSADPNIFDVSYYSSDAWDPSERDWNYIINFKIDPPPLS